MQVPHRPLGSYGYSVRNYAAAPLLPASSSKPSGGRKSFTIDALLAEPEDSSPGQAEEQQGYQPLQLVPLQPHGGSAALPTYVFQPAALHAHARYPGYCCWPPYSCQPTSCRAAFYSQAPPMSRVHVGSLNPFKAKGGKSKRMRTSFTSEQLSRLEKEFARQQYMVGSERFLLASALQLTEAQVKVWFQNRRIKWRKQSLEQQQAKLAKLGLAAPHRSPGSQGQVEEEEEEEEEDFSNLDVDVSDC